MASPTHLISGLRHILVPAPILYCLDFADEKREGMAQTKIRTQARESFVKNGTAKVSQPRHRLCLSTVWLLRRYAFQGIDHAAK